MPMTIEVAPDLEAMVRKQVDAGKYLDADEAVNEALQLLKQRDELEELRAKIKIGLDQLDRGEGVALTPALVKEMSDNAYRKWSEGKQPNPDVLP